MASINEALAMAVEYHQAGRLQAASQVYQQILAVQPNQPDAWHLLGVIAHQVGQHEVAIEYIGRAIALNGTSAAFHSNLGIVLQNRGKFDEAVASYRRALELTPDDAQAHSNLGNAFLAQGKFDEAIASYRRALELKPEAGTHNNLGNAFLAQGKFDEAIASYSRAVKLKPDYAEAHSNIGNVLKYQGKPGEAVASYRRAIALKPDYAEAHSNLGVVLKDQGKLAEAIAASRQALTLKPDIAEAHSNLASVLQDLGHLDEASVFFRHVRELLPNSAEAHNNLGYALHYQGKLDEAVGCYRRALELKPDFAVAHSNLGYTLHNQLKLDEAVACYDQALEIEPNYPLARYNRALVWLLTGDWKRGWPEFEWRWQATALTPRRFSQPLWDGTSLAGKTILLYAEQGLGDTIQFIRYAAEVKQRGGTVIVECQKPLLGLLEGCPGIDLLIGQDTTLPAFDVHAPLLSLPGILKTSLETIPANVPYLHPKPVLLERWQKRLDQLDGFKIGISWQGNPRFREDRFRSIPLRCFAPLGQIPGVRLISLQKEAGTEQLAEVRNLCPITDFADELDQQGAFLDTAAVMKNLDLVISPNTATAHLAGALGVSTWVALPFVPDWRWLLDRPDSPWYPTIRLFRQREHGDWTGVFEQIQNALTELLQGATGQV